MCCSRSATDGVIESGKMPLLQCCDPQRTPAYHEIVIRNHGRARRLLDDLRDA